MTNLPISSKYRSRATAPVSEGDREEITDRLNDAFTENQIDADQYRSLLDQAYAARTLGELAPVAEQLPALRTYQEPAIVAQEGRLKPGQVNQVDPARASALARRTAVGVGLGIVLLVVLVLMLTL